MYKNYYTKNPIEKEKNNPEETGPEK